MGVLVWCACDGREAVKHRCDRVGVVHVRDRQEAKVGEGRSLFRTHLSA